MTINERFKTIIDVLFGGNKRAFAIHVGVNPTVVENVVGKRQGKPSFDFLEKVCANANISAEWLLMGKGEMAMDMFEIRKAPMVFHSNPERYIEEGKKEVTDETDILYDTPSQDAKNKNIEFRPRIPIDAAAGSLSIALSSVSENECELMPIIPTLPEYSFTILARGDSMTPDILSGDELACRFINEKGFIQWGRIHVLDTAQGVVVKRIFDANDTIICRSSNSNYPDFSIPKNEIYHLAIVVGLVRQV